METHGITSSFKPTHNLKTASYTLLYGDRMIWRREHALYIILEFERFIELLPSRTVKSVFLPIRHDHKWMYLRKAWVHHIMYVSQIHQRMKALVGARRFAGVRSIYNMSWEYSHRLNVWKAIFKKALNIITKLHEIRPCFTSWTDWIAGGVQ